LINLAERVSKCDPDSAKKMVEMREDGKVDIE
jgi:hypothetical protein